MHCVMTTSAFEADIKRLNLSEEARYAIVNQISNDPFGGDIIPKTGGARKRRFPRLNSGKRSGYRVVWYYAADDVPVIVLAIFDKGEKINLSMAERNELKKELSGFANDYRNNVGKRVTELKRAAS